MNREIRESFTAALNFTYLNTAAIGPLPRITVAAAAKQLADVAGSGSAKMCEWLATKERVRSLIASMLGGRADDIAFTRNTSDGLCNVAAAMTWKPGDNIVSFESEFPANFYPWRHLRDLFGIELRLCPERNGRIELDEFCSLIDERTRLVTVSAVQYSSGFRVDLARIGRAARLHNALFAVDIIQAFGAIPLDLPAQFVDIAAGASYKWLCAPEGCGIFYLNERARERLTPRSYGWTSVENPWHFHDREQDFLSDARAWETGMGGSALYYGLEQSLQLLRSVGIERIENYLAQLTDFLCETVPTGKYGIGSARDLAGKSQIVSLIPLNGTSAATLVERMAREKVIVSARGNTIRIAPHFFNNFEDIATVAASLS